MQENESISGVSESESEVTFVEPEQPTPQNEEAEESEELQQLLPEEPEINSEGAVSQLQNDTYVVDMAKRLVAMMAELKSRQPVSIKTARRVNQLEKEISKISAFIEEYKPQ